MFKDREEAELKLETWIPGHGTYDCTWYELRVVEQFSDKHILDIIAQAYEGSDPHEYSTVEYWEKFPRSVLLILAGDFTNCEPSAMADMRERGVIA
jgi:hypothetical protein